jgi:hypothetical protein
MSRPLPPVDPNTAILMSKHPLIADAAGLVLGERWQSP